jgi:hypothetical protein
MSHRIIPLCDVKRESCSLTDWSRLNGSHKPDTIIVTMRVLSELPNLVSLEIFKYFSDNDEPDETHPYYSSDNDALVRDLHTQAIGSLRKMYVSTQRVEKGTRITFEYWIWRFKGLWQGTKTPGFTSWVIINGRF